MSFDDTDILDQLEAATAEQLDALSFGVVRMDLQGVVRAYNSFESRLSGLSVDRVVGKAFFEQVAPCTNNYMVSECFSADSLDKVLDYVFTFRMKPTKVRLRLLKSTAAAYQYMLIHKD